MGNPTDLAYWINEREHMRLRKEEGHLPYSRDPNMANVRYCNVHRENDKVTKWIAKNWRNPNADDPNLTFAMVAARMINLPVTLGNIGYPDNPLGAWMRQAKRRMLLQPGKKWTSAYTISTCGKRMGKEEYVFDHVLAQVAELPWEEFWRHQETSLAYAHEHLTRIDGLGSFLAAQVVADLKNTPDHPLSRAPDFWTWSAPGPGSLRGLAAYYGTPITPSNYQSAINIAYEQTMPLVADFIQPIHMQDFQNCLCEYSKFVRVRAGGHVRNKYPSR